MNALEHEVFGDDLGGGLFVILSFYTFICHSIFLFFMMSHLTVLIG